MSIQSVTVRDETAYRAAITKYAQQGYITIRDGGTSTTMSKKKPFNWVLAIVCLFIPIIGWIALLLMIIAAGRGNKVVEIDLKPT